MSNEISIQSLVELVNGEVDESLDSSILKFDENTKILSKGILDVPLGGVLLPLGPITTPGFFCFINIGTNRLTIADSATPGLPVVRLRPGAPANGEWNGAGFFVDAPDGASKLRYLIVERP